MNKSEKMAAKAKRRHEKERELERLSNKELIVFTVGLVAEIVLMFFYSALKSTVAIKAAWVLAWLSGAFFIGFVALLVAGIMKGKKGGSAEKAASLKNWSFCALAFSIGSLLIAMGRIVEKIAAATGWDLSLSWGRYFVNGSYFQPRSMAVYMMAIVGVYVIGAMIYYAIKSYKVKKS